MIYPFNPPVPIQFDDLRQRYCDPVYVSTPVTGL